MFGDWIEIDNGKRTIPKNIQLIGAEGEVTGFFIW